MISGTGRDSRIRAGTAANGAPRAHRKYADWIFEGESSRRPVALEGGCEGQAGRRRRATVAAPTPRPATSPIPPVARYARGEPSADGGAAGVVTATGAMSAAAGAASAAGAAAATGEPTTTTPAIPG